MRCTLLWVSLLAFICVSPVAGAASDAGPTVAEELLEIVRAAGIIDDAKYEELRKRAQAEQNQRVEAAVQEAVAAMGAAKPAGAVARRMRAKIFFIFS